MDHNSKMMRAANRMISSGVEPKSAYKTALNTAWQDDGTVCALSHLDFNKPAHEHWRLRVVGVPADVDVSSHNVAMIKLSMDAAERGVISPVASYGAGDANGYELSLHDVMCVETFKPETLTIKVPRC